MSDNDDLGSFFAEIQEIESSSNVNDNIIINNSNSNQITNQPTNQVANQSIIGPTIPPNTKISVVAVSKPAIKSHTVYTYDNITNNQTNEAINTLNNETLDNKSSNIPTTVINPSYLSSNNTSSSTNTSTNNKKKKFVRVGGGDVWVDDSLAEWPDNDFRVFVGDLGKEINTDSLTKAFQHYKSFAKAKVVKTKIENKGRGYGFVSFLEPMDCAKAIREMNGKYLGSRPLKLRMSTWKDHDINVVKQQDKKKRKLQESLGIV